MKISRECPNCGRTIDATDEVTVRFVVDAKRENKPGFGTVYAAIICYDCYKAITSAWPAEAIRTESH